MSANSAIDAMFPTGRDECEHGSMRRKCLVCELTLERDEHSKQRADAEECRDSLREALAKAREEVDRQSAQMDAWMRKRDRAYAERDAAERARDEALEHLKLETALSRSWHERCDEARAALRACEWGDRSHGRKWCPVCSGTPGTSQCDGHAEDCIVGRALVPPAPPVEEGPRPDHGSVWHPTKGEDYRPKPAALAPPSHPEKETK